MQNSEKERFIEALNNTKFSYKDKFQGAEKRRKKRIKEKVLDLHGYTSARAEEIVETALRNSKMSAVTQIKIICGRGIHSDKAPVLRGSVENTLKRMKSYFEKYFVDLNNNFTVMMRQK